MLIDRSTSNLIIIDIQEKLMPRVHVGKQVIENCSSLVKAAHLLKIPMVMTEQYSKGLGLTVSDVSDPAEGQAQIIDKNSFSAMKEGLFHNYLTEMASGENAQLILAGVEAHICILQTALDLKAHGYEVFVVADAIGSRSEFSYKIALERMQANGVHLTTTEMVLFEWVGTSDNPDFKELQSLVL